MDHPVPPLGPKYSQSPTIAILAAPGCSAHQVLDITATIEQAQVAEITASNVQSGVLESVGALLVLLSAAAGVDADTVTVWESAAELSLPRAVVVALPHDARVDFDEMVAITQRVLDDDMVARYLPMLDDDGTFAGVLDLIATNVVDWSSGRVTTRSPDPEHLALTAEARTELIEAVLTHHVDDDYMRRHIDGGTIAPAELAQAFNECVAEASLFPVVPLSVPTVHELVRNGMIPGAQLRL